MAFGVIVMFSSLERVQPDPETRPEIVCHAPYSLPQADRQGSARGVLKKRRTATLLWLTNEVYRPRRDSLEATHHHPVKTLLLSESIFFSGVGIARQRVQREKERRKGSETSRDMLWHAWARLWSLVQHGLTEVMGEAIESALFPCFALY